jgi:hypothetical protein
MSSIFFLTVPWQNLCGLSVVRLWTGMATPNPLLNGSLNGYRGNSGSASRLAFHALQGWLGPFGKPVYVHKKGLPGQPDGYNSSLFIFYSEMEDPDEGAGEKQVGGPDGVDAATHQELQAPDFSPV